MEGNTVESIEMLLPQLSWSTAMIMLCVTVHGIGLATITHFVTTSDSDQRGDHFPPVSVRGIAVTLAIVYSLFVLHGVEIWLFALFFRMVNAFPTLETAIYYSIISYGTIGYDDVAMARNWRVIGALEGICGIILLGWSTAYFVRFLGRIDLKGR